MIYIYDEWENAVGKIDTVEENVAVDAAIYVVENDVVEPDEDEEAIAEEGKDEMPNLVRRRGARSDLRTNNRPVNSHKNTFAREFNYTIIVDTEKQGAQRDQDSIMKKRREWNNRHDEPGHR